MGNTTSAPPRPIDADPVVSLSAEEYMALDFAAGMLDARADQLVVDGLAALAGICQRAAATLRGLHDRWHRASVLAIDGVLHDGRCAWCRDGGAA